MYFHRGPFRGKKADKTPWKIKHIEMNPEKVLWSNGGKVPNYIQLVGIVGGKEQTIWTCENRLQPTGIKQ